MENEPNTPTPTETKTSTEAADKAPKNWQTKLVDGAITFAFVAVFFVTGFLVLVCLIHGLVAIGEENFFSFSPHVCPRVPQGMSFRVYTNIGDTNQWIDYHEQKGAQEFTGKFTIMPIQ